MRLKFFLRENSYSIVKIIIYQIVLTIFGLCVTMAVGSATDSKAVLAGVSIFAILFYLFLIGTAMYELGAKDKIRVDAGRMRRDSILGLKIGFCAGVLNLLFAALMLIGYLFGFAGLMAADWGKGLFGVAYTLGWLLESMYTGLFAVITSYVPPESSEPLHYGVVVLLYLLATVPPMLASFGGYLVGLNDNRVRPSSGNSD